MADRKNRRRCRHRITRSGVVYYNISQFFSFFFGTAKRPLLAATGLVQIPESLLPALKRKFDVAKFVAAENLPLTIFAKICDLEKHHGVNIGTSYLSDHSCRDFVDFIAKAQRHSLKEMIKERTFFSLVMDGSTDKEKIDVELFLAITCDLHDESTKQIKYRLDYTYLTVVAPKATTGQGLFDCVVNALKVLGIDDVNADASNCHKLVGVGTDGASANIAAAGLKGLMQDRLPWLFWMWCLAHRVELAVKDALKNTFFDQLDNMLMRKYYLYENSPKKMRELKEIVANLKEVFKMRPGGVNPVRVCGSR